MAKKRQFTTWQEREAEDEEDYFIPKSSVEQSIEWPKDPPHDPERCAQGDHEHITYAYRVGDICRGCGEILWDITALEVILEKATGERLKVDTPPPTPQGYWRALWRAIKGQN